MKLITGIFGLLLILTLSKCTKDEPIATDQPLHESITGLRTGDPLSQFFSGSLTIFNPDGSQVILNPDSINQIEYAKIKNSTATVSNPVTAQYFKASQFRILISWKDGSNDLSGTYYRKDTTAVRFTIVPKSGNKLNSKYLTFTRTEKFIPYYDYRYFRNKKQFMYRINQDSVYLQSWHHPSSNIYLLDHKN